MFVNMAGKSVVESLGLTAEGALGTKLSVADGKVKLQFEINPESDNEGKDPSTAYTAYAKMLDTMKSVKHRSFQMTVDDPHCDGTGCRMPQFEWKMTANTREDLTNALNKVFATQGVAPIVVPGKVA